MAMMNEEAAALGAVNTHFMNPHGLQDEDHYTTVYDMYLIFQEALKYDDFTDIISHHNPIMLPTILRAGNEREYHLGIHEPLFHQ